MELAWEDESLVEKPRTRPDDLLLLGTGEAATTEVAFLELMQPINDFPELRPTQIRKWVQYGESIPTSGQMGGKKKRGGKKEENGG